MKIRIALIAHDKKKDDMIVLAAKYECEGRIDCIIFLCDPMTPQPYEPDINALVHACDAHDVACATNMATARLLLTQLQATQHHHSHS